LKQEMVAQSVSEVELKEVQTAEKTEPVETKSSVESVDDEKALGYYALLRYNAPYRTLLIADAIALTGDWFTYIATLIVLGNITDSGVAIR
jgi:hypothetical protein